MALSCVWYVQALACIHTWLSSTQNGRTSLHLACHYGHLEVVKMLMASGSDVKAKTNVGIVNG